MAKKLTINGGKPNNITVTHRELVRQWDYSRNGNLVPEMFDIESTTVVFWKCPTCGGFWRKSVSFRTHKDNGCPFCNNRKVLKGFNDLDSRFPDAAKMLLPENNDGVHADEILFCECGRKRKWYCESCDLTFDATVREVVKNGCHICGKHKRKKLLSLAELYPSIANDWDEERNGISAQLFMPWGKSDSVYWWHCENCGQSYQMRLISKTQDRGCPVCQGKIVVRGYNDIDTLKPEVADLWSDKNGEKKSWMYTIGSGKQAWFICPECGEERYAHINAICNISTLCGKCSGKLRSRMHIEKYGSLKDRYPAVAEQWHPSKNGDITPDMVSPRSDFLAYWYCRKHEYTWSARVATRTSKGNAIGNCPECIREINMRPEHGSSLKDLYPKIADEWDYDNNDGMRPEDFAPMSHKHVSWICPKCDSHYVKRISHRTVYGRGCSCTSQKLTSFPEKAIFHYVSMVYPEAIPNYKPSNDIFGRMEVDVYIPSINTGIEYDGEYWHQDSERDETKDYACFLSSMQLIRVRESKCPDYDLTICYRKVVRADQSDKALDDCIREVLGMISPTSEVDVDTKRDHDAIMSLLD